MVRSSSAFDFRVAAFNFRVEKAVRSNQSPVTGHLFGSQVPNQIFPIKTLASVAPRHDDWAMHEFLPRELLFQAANLVDQWLKSMLISKKLWSQTALRDTNAVATHGAAGCTRGGRTRCGMSKLLPHTLRPQKLRPPTLRPF
jgi:hypothetical protein